MFLFWSFALKSPFMVNFPLPRLITGGHNPIKNPKKNPIKITLKFQNKNILKSIEIPMKIPIGSMVLLYMVTFTINIPPMLAYIPAPWILWDPWASIIHPPNPRHVQVPVVLEDLSLHIEAQTFPCRGCHGRRGNQWSFQDPTDGGTVHLYHIFKAIFWGYIPLHRPEK